jgi:putative transposase
MAVKKHKMLHPQASVNKMCRIFGKSKQAFYKQTKTIDTAVVKAVKAEVIVEKVKYMKKKLPMLGGRKVKYMLARRKINVGRDTLFDILRENRLLVMRKRKYARTTQSKHWLKKHNDIFNCTRIEKPEQAFVSDITYIRVKDDFSYLSLITDAYSKRIMGSSLSQNLTREGPLNALKEALQNRMYNHPLMHHSDRGFQYCSQDYIERLQQSEIKVSMTESGSPYDNAIAERVNGILKSELGLDAVFEDHERAKKAIEVAIKRYNKIRPHLSCGYLTPNQAHKTRKPLIKVWKQNKTTLLNFNS